MSPHLVNAIHELETSLDDIHRKYESSVYSERTLQARKFHATAVTVRNAIAILKPLVGPGSLPTEDQRQHLAS